MFFFFSLPPPSHIKLWPEFRSSSYKSAAFRDRVHLRGSHWSSSSSSWGVGAEGDKTPVFLQLCPPPPPEATGYSIPTLTAGGSCRGERFDSLRSSSSLTAKKQKKTKLIFEEPAGLSRMIISTGVATTFNFFLNHFYYDLYDLCCDVPDFKVFPLYRFEKLSLALTLLTHFSFFF